LSSPRAAICIAAVAVIDFPMEAVRYRVSARARTLFSTSAKPNASDQMTRPLLPIAKLAPGTCAAFKRVPISVWSARICRGVSLSELFAEAVTGMAIRLPPTKAAIRKTARNCFMRLSPPALHV
jgi:hypothetical protein